MEHCPDLTDSWTVTFDFSKPIIADWVQVVDKTSGGNHGASSYNFIWKNTTQTPTIYDPNKQLQNKSTGIGNANFRISTNPGVGSVNDGGVVFNNSASWLVESVPSSELQITWSATATTFTQNEWITISGNSVEVVPEPLTILGTGTAIAFGTGFKRKLAKAKKK